MMFYVVLLSNAFSQRKILSRLDSKQNAKSLSSQRALQADDADEDDGLSTALKDVPPCGIDYLGGRGGAE